jgi:hypothetical protein
MSQVFSSTLFFTTKDGRLFCEVDSFDGSYEECTLTETAGMKLEKAVFPSARLIDTPNEKICVEYSTQVDMSLCQEEIDLMKKYLTAKTGSTTSGATSTGVLFSGSTASGSNVNSGIAIEKQIHQQVQTIVNNIGTQDEWTTSLQSTYVSCIPDYWSDDCMREVQNIVSMISKIGVYLVLTVVLAVLYIFIFWLSMMGHVLGNSVPRKIIWIPVVIF